ncbi:hypothetical protein MSG28_002949 [Choristoneura fumiferana]|uniref:Uncharacterized protein n=1 Tax=Choristoneura fumiferana TaxID=7141 RepID=A0ACC0JK46_CHOFU|nr:hypothetical protein MSG28_002949 [Choristoneura fumiferana]
MPKISKLKLNRRARMLEMIRSSRTIRNCPKKLSVLCKNVIRKYNLTKPKLENKQKFVEPESCTIIGGKIKEELEPIADNQDPLAPEAEDYTVIVKEEFEADEETRLVAQSTATSETITMPTLVPSRNVAPSRSSLPSATSGPPLMTVVADEMQIFANNLAEQLRTFPIDRALLLQLEIQTMIDNERQLLLH